MDKILSRRSTMRERGGTPGNRIKEGIKRRYNKIRQRFITEIPCWSAPYLLVIFNGKIKINIRI